MEFTIRQVCIPVIFCIGVNSYAITHPDVLLTQYGVSRDYVKNQILYKCNRALERYHKNGEV